jgi:Kef-type K+ transport system membrane component KefB
MSDDTFYGILLLLTAVGVGYVISHVAVERLSRRHLVVADVQYVVLGVVLGPLVGIVDPTRTEALRPVLLLGCGALGMLAGLRLRQSRGDWWVAGGVSVATAGIAIGAPWLLMQAVGDDVAGAHAFTGALISAGVVAMMTTDSGVLAMARYLGARGVASPRAAGVAAQSAALAIVGYGGLFALVPNGDALQFRGPVVMLQNVAVQIGAGGALGLLFAASVYRKLDERVLLAVLVGTVFLAAGVARTMHVSTVFVCFVVGLVFSLASPRAPEVTVMLDGIKRPFVITLFFFAGLEWVSGPAWSYAAVPVYLGLRWAGRRAGGLLGQRLTRQPRDYAAALLPAGGLAVALLLGLRVSYPDLPGLRETYGALLAAVVLSDILALRAVRRWVIDADDVPVAGRERRGGFDPGMTS